MIKPGTVCQIRGLPKDSPARTAEGQIVTVIQYLGEFKEFAEVYQFQPHVVIMGVSFDKCQRKWLHPFDDFEDDLNREALDEVLENTFCETLAKELEKIK
jgi:hypothetical protein